MGKRKLPFGYQMKQGEVTIHEAEAAVVHEIFEKYVSGASYLEITKMLKNQPVAYQPDKLWNKNMVARILENVRYIGENGFPPIIEKDVFQRAAEKRSGKQGSPRKTAAQKNNQPYGQEEQRTCPEYERGLCFILGSGFCGCSDYLCAVSAVEVTDY